MYINWDHCKTGWPSQLTLKRVIPALARRSRRFKIGITGDPESRAHGYNDYDYDEMLVLYQTSSERYCRETEKVLIDRYRDDCDNSIGGGGGRLEGPPYYLYVVRQW